MSKNEFIKIGNITKLIINSNTYGKIETLIDEDDITKIKKYTWRAVRERNKNYYRIATGQGTKMLLLYRYILNCPTDMVVDHINRNPLDNRKKNLRICTQYQNIANRQNTLNVQSGEKYIYWNNKNNKWIIRVRKNLKQFYLGCTSNLKEAIKIRDNFKNPQT